MTKEYLCEICGQPLETEHEVEQGFHDECSLNDASAILWTEEIPPNVEDL